MSDIIEKMKPLQDIHNKKQHVTNFFGNLKFDAEEHTYKHNKRYLNSVSSVIKNYVEPFDADRIAGYVAKSRGVSKEDILLEWEMKKVKACEKGNRVHNFGENYKKGMIASDGYEKAVISFWDSIPKHIEPFLFELQMFSLEKNLVGTADIILYNTKTGNFVIADYKTNIDLYKNYRGKKMLYPFDDMLDMPLSKYKIQLSLYQYLFEQCGFKVEQRKIIWLKEDGTFDDIQVENLIDRIIY